MAKTPDETKEDILWHIERFGGVRTATRLDVFIVPYVNNFFDKFDDFAEQYKDRLYTQIRIEEYAPHKDAEDRLWMSSKGFKDWCSSFEDFEDKKERYKQHGVDFDCRKSRFDVWVLVM